jgi:diacylglycerol kinase (ATP)
MANTLVILNPVSGNGHAGKLWPQIEAELRRGGLDFDVARTTAPRSGVALAEHAKQNGYETLVAVGGDGTTNEVANGMLRASAGELTGILGVIPVGSGNDFTKMLPAPLRPGTSDLPNWRASVHQILAAETRWIDVGEVTADHPAPGFDAPTHYYLNGLDTGFGALVAMHAHEIPFLQGFPMYLTAVFKTLIKYSVPRVRIKVDQSTLEQASTMIAVSNGRCIGGGFWITPTALNDDGLLDVMVAQGLGRIGILSLLPKVMKGTHLDDPRVTFKQGAHVTIESSDPLVIETDGEIPFIDAHHIEIKLLPSRLRVIV